MTDDAGEYLSFRLDATEFGVDILCVQEIMVWSPVTIIPNTPDYLKGVINLRGLIVPIVDLRERFNLGEVEYDETTVVIVLRTSVESETVVGIVVDAVSDVHKFSDKEIVDAPDFGQQIDSRFLLGMAPVDDRLILLLATNKLLDVDELFVITQQANPIKKKSA